jgi:hypothetical protein
MIFREDSFQNLTQVSLGNNVLDALMVALMKFIRETLVSLPLT